MCLRSQQLGWDSHTAECSLQLQAGNGGTPVWGTLLTTLLSLVTSDRTQGNEMKLRLVQKGSSLGEAAGALKQALLGSGWGTKPIRVQGASGMCS